jgi:hypothetical protein
LALFSVPVILLEPVKFVAAYIAATGNFIAALFTFASGELLKIVLIERLFDLTREKLLKISAFAWIYGHYVQAREWIKRSEAWQAIRRLSQSARQAIRSWRALAKQVARSPRPMLDKRQRSLNPPMDKQTIGGLRRMPSLDGARAARH